MNRIEKLIAELCPEGVEWKKLGEVCVSLKKDTLKLTDLIPNGKYPVINSGREWYGRYNSYNNEGNALTIAARGEYAGCINYINEKFWAGGLCYPYRSKNENFILTKYIFYALKAHENIIMQTLVSRGSIPALNKTDIDNFPIPLPPLPIQEEIVKILDTFTALEAELEAELEARRKQYEYYRNTLLTPVEHKGRWYLNGKEVEWKKLGEIGKISMCKRIFKNQTSQVGEIPFYKIGTFGGKPDSFISRELYEKYKQKYPYPKKGDILLSASGTIGKRVIFNGEPSYFQDSNIIWIDNKENVVLNKFLYYLYEIIDWKTEGGTIQRLYNDNLKRIKIPIPPLSEQERIVAILDKFDALVNDISQGLPAEIEARRKQYEYYRNKLLTFRKKNEI
jgi:type I restriction enzyme S subunit